MSDSKSSPASPEEPMVLIPLSIARPQVEGPEPKHFWRDVVRRFVEAQYPSKVEPDTQVFVDGAHRGVCLDTGCQLWMFRENAQWMVYDEAGTLCEEGAVVDAHVRRTIKDIRLTSLGDDPVTPPKMVALVTSVRAWDRWLVRQEITTLTPEGEGMRKALRALDAHGEALPQAVEAVKISPATAHVGMTPELIAMVAACEAYDAEKERAQPGNLLSVGKAIRDTFQAYRDAPQCLVQQGWMTDMELGNLCTEAGFGYARVEAGESAEASNRVLIVHAAEEDGDAPIPERSSTSASRMLRTLQAGETSVIASTVYRVLAELAEENGYVDGAHADLLTRACERAVGEIRGAKSRGM